MKKNIKKELIEYLIIILVVLFIRFFIITPIKVQQKSMFPTLNPNDIMILDKISLKLGNIERFDIVVIKYEKEYLIKRVIGLPGEIIEYKEGKLYVNGKQIPETFIRVNTADFKLEEKIKDDNYFLVGDNRNNSTDSRAFGSINKKDIVGKTSLIVFPFNRFGLIN